jgi:type I restriction enzyme, R subunit
MTFNESNTVEACIRDRLAGSVSPTNGAPGVARQGSAISGLGWYCIGPADLPRQSPQTSS